MRETMIYIGPSIDHLIQTGVRRRISAEGGGGFEKRAVFIRSDDPGESAG